MRRVAGLAYALCTITFLVSGERLTDSPDSIAGTPRWWLSSTTISWFPTRTAYRRPLPVLFPLS